MKKFIFIVILFIVLSGVWIKGLQWYMAKKIETKVDQTLEEASDQQMRIQRQVEEEIKRAREAGN